ncbi:MAG: gas vesicle protein K [Methylocystis sp.]|nr:gas vesicle protein K [Methylocystis sp.]
MLVPEQAPANAARPGGDRLSLTDALDRILHRGVAVQGNLTIGLADVDLLFLDLRLLLGSVDAIWPDGRPPIDAVQPQLPAPPRSGAPIVAPSPIALRSAVGAEVDPGPPMVANGRPNEPGSSTAQGLVRLVLTLVKLLHEVLERQAVRRMEAGRLTEAQIEDVGMALFAQAEEIVRLQRQFGFSDREISLNLGVPNGAL